MGRGRSWSWDDRGLDDVPGYLGQARYALSTLSSILPVKVLPYDDRMEIPEGARPKPIAANHPILQGWKARYGRI